MQSFEDYQKESERLKVLNQRFAFLMGAVNYVKVRAASKPDLALEIRERKILAEMDSMIDAEVPAIKTDKPVKDGKLEVL